jgi:hypothetical protein
MKLILLLSLLPFICLSQANEYSNDCLQKSGNQNVKTFDILINEIMADPNPPVDLPECEYLEFYNRSAQSVDLSGWCLVIGESRKALPPIIIEANGFCIITGKNDTVMNDFGKVILMSGFELKNSGNMLTLTNETGKVIHAVHYEDSWYDDHFRENGGWSLELIDPQNPCGGSDNWRASIDQSGGTPGRQNSIMSSNIDDRAPSVSFLSIPSNNSLTIHFDEPMDSISLAKPSAFQVERDGEPGNSFAIPYISKPLAPLYDEVTLTFDEEFEENMWYSLTVNDTITDCSGNQVLLGSNYRFALPYDDLSTGIIINEILYDPYAYSAEFIEIYNRTDTAFHLKDLMLVTLDNVTGSIDKTSDITETQRLFMPGEFLVLTDNPQAVRKEYFTPNPKAFIKMSDFPSLANSGGTIALATQSGQIIDRLQYSDDLHFALLHTTKGVSLERVNPGKATNEPGNWHSASQSCGFATPGYINSQFMNPGKGADETITVRPKTFSPDNDGYNDQLTIIYKHAEPGGLLTIRIFSSNGYPVKFLTGNYLAGTENTFIWDGITDDGGKAPAGVYIVLTEVLDVDGTVKSYKNVAIVASR